MTGLGRARGPAPRILAQEIRAVELTPDALADLLRGKDLSEALQQVGAKLLQAYELADEAGRRRLGALMVDLCAQIQQRGWTGDVELAEEVEATLMGAAPKGEPLQVDLVDLADEARAIADGQEQGAYVDIVTGDVRPAWIETWDGADDDEEHDEIFVEDFFNDWHDLELFAESVEDPEVAEEIRRAIDGRGAFARFREIVAQHDLRERWETFKDDRRAGRMRVELLGQGFRAVGARPVT